MKQLILITAFLVVAATKLVAQENAIEIKNSQKVTSELQKESHQFEIVAKEDVDVNLKFNLKLDDNVKVLVRNEQDKVVFSKVYRKQGNNKIAFSMVENEKYTIMLNGNRQSNMIVSISED
ncbi:hypothetical protein ACSVH2_11010 [Flavobacterium sp. RSB2_4_14]|uniref:hypothetical protein n=1 Tax=Flavobacterium sp. RSB2_4_14 TaxID=3447665 RepID=UPI003F374DF0